MNNIEKQNLIIEKLIADNWEKNRIWFEHTRYERKDSNSEFEKDRSYEMYVEILEILGGKGGD